jgi:NADH-quinone oxidoreductase subunit G
LARTIRVDTRGREVMRIMPRINEQVNEEWISDKTASSGTACARSVWTAPMSARAASWQPASWAEGFRGDQAARVAKASPTRIGAIAGDLATVEEMYALKALMAVARLAEHRLPAGRRGARPGLGRASYVFNTDHRGHRAGRRVLIIGSNPRFEASVLNARIRKRWRMGAAGRRRSARSAIRYDYEQLGAGSETLKALADGEGSFFETLKQAQRPLIIVGQGALAGAEGAAVLGLAARLAQAVNAVRDDWNGFNVLHTAAARVGGLDVGFVPGEGGKDVAGMLGALGRAVPARRRRDRHHAAARRSSSISARMATPARTAPTSSCRVRPIPKSPAPTSTPKAASS